MNTWTCYPTTIATGAEALLPFSMIQETRGGCSAFLYVCSCRYEGVIFRCPVRCLHCIMFMHCLAFPSFSAGLPCPSHPCPSSCFQPVLPSSTILPRSWANKHWRLCELFALYHCDVLPWEPGQQVSFTLCHRISALVPFFLSFLVASLVFYCSCRALRALRFFCLYHVRLLSVRPLTCLRTCLFRLSFFFCVLPLLINHLSRSLIPFSFVSLSSLYVCPSY